MHVTVQATQLIENFIDGLGNIIDFKELKALVQNGVIKEIDHKLILSKAYISETRGQFSPDEFIIFDFEPTAENLLLFLSKKISSLLPESVRLHSLKIRETRDSYAEWST